jgi:5'-nucleotidase
MERPLIFISNDDGVSAKGLAHLIHIAREFGEVFAVAPDSARSGSGCALTVNTPISLRRVPCRHSPLLPTDERKEELHPLTLYSCTGTPVDCIKLGKQVLLEQRGIVPDLVLAGINHGDNSGVNVHYSGTMGIVIEGCICGIPAIGFSIDNHSLEAELGHTDEVLRQVIGQVLREGLPKGTCLNVNFPAAPPIHGVRLCRQGMGQWTKEWEAREHPRGGTYYWLTGECRIDTDNGARPYGLHTGRLPSAGVQEAEIDFHAVHAGYAAITPIRIDMTDYDYLLAHS